MYCTQRQALYCNSFNAQAPQKSYISSTGKNSALAMPAEEGTYRAILPINNLIGENPRYITVRQCKIFWLGELQVNA
ncbi:hypothetical protein MC7420_526 [Coleofasciculus chthonoplastes PCC 7420]|uniref:Uncharacterized protein n=1 Tax=Coleofasciculus chthonoplastes PCC 7420 TaxID=118168 RepID=B4VKZ2_9CYAN|nr:hypothetical protein MC7420_5317 [Coleofasciculus chthonoplastes PCC 7420]EDX71159.1 hypothetical protein MC7420_2720 [Coleofasciculus chthonoplastes PCC 7420]EDX71522.1 hypothetical protein MC7420_88 [Coleofasciculus chthonoplastes PCC 7420]EDX75445.1 hypothetical protein MC7420_1363 [Coleofasciculus chthonoplastes PCC 7420]EDX76501.1 hypothetical protein MC7420_4757 [Coleofasciculus chthonoplastes PCC 7420]